MSTSNLRERVPRIADELAGATVEFRKFTSFGNTFIIVDETMDGLEDDGHRARFARWALNGDFGIGGADNVLYIRSVNDGDTAGGEDDFVFRIFEHDGAETLSCGNGLLSTAAFLHLTKGGTSWGVLTELPTGRPRRVEVGLGQTPGSTWVNVGWPRPVSDDLYRRSGAVPTSGIDAVPPLTVPFPAQEAWASGLPEKITMSGSLLFTGEPHLVLIKGQGLPVELENRLWLDLGEDGGSHRVGRPDTPQMVASSQLVHHIGSYVNATYEELFPQGVHLNFARIRDDEAVIEYRTYERAINCETLACGSGAVAMAHIAQTQGLLEGNRTVLWPHRCRWYQPDAILEVAETKEGFVLYGRPKLVCHGTAPKFP